MGGVRYVTFSPDGTRLAACGNDLRVRVWNAENEELLFDQRDETLTVEFDPAGDRLVTGLSDLVSLRDSRSGEIVDRFRTSNSSIAGIPLRAAFAPDGDSIVAQDSQHGLRWIDAVSAQERFYFNDRRFGSEFRFHPSGKKLAIATRVWVEPPRTTRPMRHRSVRSDR